MTEIIQTFLQEHLYRTAFIIAVCMGALVVSMALDLVSGVRKAMENGEATTSRGFKKTCEKAMKYFPTFLSAACVDVICCYVIPIPVFSMVVAGYECFCEFKSVREKAWQKAEIRKQEQTMQIILENKEDLAKAMVEVLKNMNSDKDEETRS